MFKKEALFYEDSQNISQRKESGFENAPGMRNGGRGSRNPREREHACSSTKKEMTDDKAQYRGLRLLNVMNMKRRTQVMRYNIFRRRLLVFA